MKAVTFLDVKSEPESAMADCPELVTYTTISRDEIAGYLTYLSSAGMDLTERSCDVPAPVSA